MWRGIRFIESPRAKVTGTGAAAVYRTIVAGAQALAWADPSLLQTFMAGFMPTESDPLAQRAACGWKGWAGGILVNAGGKYRHVVIESNSSLSAHLPVGVFAAEASAASTTDYGSLTLEELKAEAAAQGLPTSGTKAELIDRLTADESTVTTPPA
jgi:hypothetical protein